MSQASDVYSFGILMAECYRASSPTAGLGLGCSEIQSDAAAFRLPPECPEGYASLVRRATEGSPGLRPTFPEILAILTVRSKYGGIACNRCCYIPLWLLHLTFPEILSTLMV